MSTVMSSTLPGQHHLRAFAHEQMRGRAAEAHQLALDRSRRACQQRHLAPQSHPVLPFSPSIAGRMRHFARGLHCSALARIQTFRGDAETGLARDARRATPACTGRRSERRAA
jgi:hypothetical protein